MTKHPICRCKKCNVIECKYCGYSMTEEYDEEQKRADP